MQLDKNTLLGIIFILISLGIGYLFVTSGPSRNMRMEERQGSSYMGTDGYHSVPIHNYMSHNPATSSVK